MKQKSTRYKLMFLIPFILMSGCKKTEHEHKNVITGIRTLHNQKMLVLNDVDTDQERFLCFQGADTTFFDYFHLTDTIDIITGGIYSGDSYYKDNTILYRDAVGLKYNHDSICARHERENTSVPKQKTIPVQQRTR